MPDSLRLDEGLTAVAQMTPSNSPQNVGSLADAAPAVHHLRELAATFGEFESRWSHLRYQELGGDSLYGSGVDQALIEAIEGVYASGLDLAVGLGADLSGVTNLSRFPLVSDFIDHVEEILARIPEQESVVENCETQLALHRLPMNTWAYTMMNSLYRKQLGLLRTVEHDLAALKRSSRYRQEQDLENDPQDEGASPYAFYSRGDYWEIAFEGRGTRLKTSDGLRYIAYLLARPNEEVGIMSLRQLGSKQHAPVPEDLPRREQDLHELSEAKGCGMGASEIVDPTAIAQVRKRRSQLEQELAAAYSEEERQRIQEEIEALKDYVRNDRARFKGTLKNAHSTVQKRIASAEELIGRNLPDLERHLRRYIKTGYICIYRPDRLVRWQLEPPE